MLSSMTGFGRAHLDAPFGSLVAEFQSINRKYLDISIAMPKEFSRFEYEIRKWIGAKVFRGQVSLRLCLLPTAGSAERLLPDPNLLKGLKEGWERTCLSAGLDPRQVDLSFLMLNASLQSKADMAEDQDLPAIERCVQGALDGLVRMKRKEGQALASDLKERLAFMEKALKGIEKLAPDAVQRMQEKLTERIKKASDGSEVDERILREVFLYAERIDISEEIVRLQSHFSQFLEVIESKETSVGRKMDFLIQEIGREVNTIGSKSAEAQISRYIVEMKSELEKMREQVQNVE